VHHPDYETERAGSQCSRSHACNLKADDYEIWLDPTVRNPALVAGCFKPFDATLMKKYPVGTRVNRPENDDPECAREIAVALPKLCSDPVHLRIGLIELEFLK
jgi:putative SOS response-associated peptidase YedK